MEVPRNQGKLDQGMRFWQRGGTGEPIEPSSDGAEKMARISDRRPVFHDPTLEVIDVMIGVGEGHGWLCGSVSLIPVISQFE